jgi:hypothetical protein
MTFCGLTAFVFTRSLAGPHTSVLQPYQLRHASAHAKCAIAVCLLIIGYDIGGLMRFESSVFDSKEFLDELSYTKFPINLKIYSGLVLGILYPKYKGWSLVHLIASLCFSFLFAERLHVMEFLVAFLIGCSLSRQLTFSAASAGKAAFAVIALVIFYEASRNFYVLYFIRGSGTDVSDGLLNLFERMAAYYGDTTNKFALAIEADHDFVPFLYLSWLFSQLTKSEYWFHGHNLETVADDLGMSYENLTNIGAFALLYTDFGVLAIPLVVLLGVLPFWFFVLSRRRQSLFYAMLAVVFSINCLELPRIFYLFNLRAWIWFPFLLMFYVVITGARPRSSDH